LLSRSEEAASPEAEPEAPEYPSLSTPAGAQMKSARAGALESIQTAGQASASTSNRNDERTIEHSKRDGPGRAHKFRTGFIIRNSNAGKSQSGRILRQLTVFSLA
jgi:hypothetical protein